MSFCGVFSFEFGVCKSNRFGQSERGAVHVRNCGDITDVMEADNVLFFEFGILHRLRYSFCEEGLCLGFFRLLRESIHVDQGKLGFAIHFPHFWVAIIVESDESIEKLNCIHRQIHEAMVKSQKLFWDGSFLFSVNLCVD